MLSLSYVFFVFGMMVFAEESKVNSSTSSVVADVSIVSFLDELNNIRINMSWQEVVCDCDEVSISFNNYKGCNAIINDIEKFSLRDNEFLVIPNMEIKAPADDLMNNCEYEIIFEAENSSIEPQKLVYKVPECVENKCSCRHARKSPYQLDEISIQHDNVHRIHWNKTGQEVLTINEIYYRKSNNNLTTIIPHGDIHQKDDFVDVVLTDLKEGVLYRVTVGFDDKFNECSYFSSINITVPVDRNDVYVGLIILVPLLIACLSILLVMGYFPRAWKKISNYLGCKDDIQQSSYLETPLAINFRDLRVNELYTPMEFEVNADKFDDFEIPRNKVILEKKLDDGAFGTVFSGKVVGLNGYPKYTMVAVKQMKDGAAEERLYDFLNEIEIMKKIGEHENIIKLLGCVTIDTPYMLIMELVPCGSLKRYLTKLRDQWTKIRNQRFFFPDHNIGHDQTQPLKYTSVIFGNDSNCSYIIPDNFVMDESELMGKIPSPPPKKLKPLNLASDRKRLISEGSQLPLSPISLTSSHFHSSTNTEITVLETPSPLMNEMSDLLLPILDHNELQNFAYQIAKGMRYLESIQITHRDLAARNVLISSDKTLKISDFGLSRAGIYVSSIGARLPLRWMALEAIEARTCDTKSDVWSYGVVLWEIGTLGALPYKNIDDCQILPSLKAGKRLERPGICTDDLYSLMLKCWLEDPQERPTFYELVNLLDSKKRNIYVDFKEVSPEYEFPPTAVGDADDGSGVRNSTT